MRRLFKLGFAILLATSLAACPEEDQSSDGDADVDGGGDADSDGDADEAADAGVLAATGAVGDWCAPDDGRAISVVIGAASSCTVAPGSEPQVHLFAYPASTPELGAGDSWSFDEPGVAEGLSAEWFPDGAGGDHEPASSGSLEVLSVGGDHAVFRYGFVTAAGDRYAGDATVLVCPSDPICG